VGAAKQPILADARVRGAHVRRHLPFGNINEGTYEFNKDDVDLHGGELSSLWCRDGMFVLLTGTSISSLFVCIASCLMVMRRMSSYMIERSSNLVDRLSISTGLAHQISGTAQEGHSGPELERVLVERSEADSTRRWVRSSAPDPRRLRDATARTPLLSLAASAGRCSSS
jgi:hypothetical protein